MFVQPIHVVTHAPFADLSEIREIFTDLACLEGQGISHLLRGDDFLSLSGKLLQETLVLDESFDCGFGDLQLLSRTPGGGGESSFTLFLGAILSRR